MPHDGRILDIRRSPLTMLLPNARYYAVLWFEDKTTGFCGSKKLLEFGHYEDLHSAIGSVSLEGDRLVVKPYRGYAHELVIEVPPRRAHTGRAGQHRPG